MYTTTEGMPQVRRIQSSAIPRCLVRDRKDGRRYESRRWGAFVVVLFSWSTSFACKISWDSRILHNPTASRRKLLKRSTTVPLFFLHETHSTATLEASILKLKLLPYTVNIFRSNSKSDSVAVLLRIHTSFVSKPLFKPSRIFCVNGKDNCFVYLKFLLSPQAMKKNHFLVQIFTSLLSRAS